MAAQTAIKYKKKGTAKKGQRNPSYPSLTIGERCEFYSMFGCAETAKWAADCETLKWVRCHSHYGLVYKHAF